jgi:hypothetical protein
MKRPAHVLIPVINDARRGSEEVEVEPLGGDRYRVLCPPRFAYGLAVGDEIELDDQTPFGFRTVVRSGNLTVWFYVRERGQERALANAARDLVGPIGATIEGTPDRMLILTVPLSAGWGPIEAVMNRIAAALPGTSWEYGNVYDPQDGKTPIKWWFVH